MRTVARPLKITEPWNERTMPPARRADYDTDTIRWSEHQARLIERIARGEKPNEEPDWNNIIEEIRAVGRSELSSVRSLLFQALVHHLKTLAWPDAQPRSHWEAEMRSFLAQARHRFQPGMRSHIKLAALYTDARQALPDEIDRVSPREVPKTCPFALDELLPSPEDVPAQAFPLDEDKADRELTIEAAGIAPLLIGAMPSPPTPQSRPAPSPRDRA